MPTEASIERACKRIAEREGHTLLKTHHSLNGFPDRLLILRGGGVIFIEFKRPLGAISMIQHYWLNRLREMGQDAHVISSAKAFREVLTLATAGRIMAPPLPETTDDLLAAPRVPDPRNPASLLARWRGDVR